MEGMNSLFKTCGNNWPSQTSQRSQPSRLGPSVREVPMPQATADWAIWSGLPQKTGTPPPSRQST